MSTKEYSCVKRTKRCFENSFAALAKERPINKITVKMLCEHAQLSRNAFYFHYKDINDLIRDIEDGIVNEALSNFDTYKEMGFPNNTRAIMEGIIELIDSRREVCRMLLESSETFTGKISEVFREFNYQYFEEYHGKENINREGYDFFYVFISNGFYGLIKHWLDNPDKMSKQEIVGLACVFVNRLLVEDDPEIEFMPNKEK